MPKIENYLLQFKLNQD